MRLVKKEQRKRTFTILFNRPINKDSNLADYNIFGTVIDGDFVEKITVRGVMHMRPDVFLGPKLVIASNTHQKCIELFRLNVTTLVPVDLIDEIKVCEQTEITYAAQPAVV